MSRFSRNAGGYTIIEVIIVLTVSTLLFAASVIGYSAQNRRTQFTQSVNNFAQDIQDVLNDVENGFYPTTHDFSCRVSGNSAPIIDPPGVGTPTEQGKNTDCIFIGRAIQFAPFNGADPDYRSKIDIYTVVGRRTQPNGTNEPSLGLDDAMPTAISNVSNLIEHDTLVSGVRIQSVRRADTNGALSGFAMVSTLSNGAAISTGLNNRASLATIPGNVIFTNAGTFTTNVSNITSANVNNASRGIRICLREQGSNRPALIELATEGSQIIVNTEIDRPCS